MVRISFVGAETNRYKRLLHSYLLCEVGAQAFQRIAAHSVKRQFLHIIQLLLIYLLEILSYIFIAHRQHASVEYDWKWLSESALPRFVVR